MIRDGRKAKDRNWTQRELADRVGVAVATVSEWENERTPPQLADINPICRYLELSPHKLLMLLGIDLTPAPIDLLDTKTVRLFRALTPDQEKIVIDLMLTLAAIPKGPK